jgi:hypothetical protein
VPLEIPTAPRILVEHDGGLQVLAYLQKRMPFSEVLQRFEQPLKFEGSEVRTFRNEPILKGDYSPIFEQTVQVESYMSDEQFVLSLTTDTPQRDEIYLARIEPRETLRKTWLQVVALMDELPTTKEGASLKNIDRLQIPIVSFNLLSQMPELVNVRIPTDGKPDRYIHDVRQAIRFRMDERGAILESDTHMVVGDDEPPGHGRLPKPRKLIFDRPFLIAVREQNAEQPYFLAWVGNAALIEPFVASGK